MSVVVNVCGSNFTLMVSDNRLVRYDENNLMEIVSENYKKIFRINKNILIGLTGDAIKCSYIFNILQERILYDSYILEVKDILANILQNIENEPNDLGIRIIISGRRSDGSFVSYSFDSKKNFKDELYEPNGYKNCIVYGVPEASEPFHNYEAIIDSTINNNKYCSTDELAKIIGQAIHKISKLNKSVNNVISYEVLC